jgi:outer membrane protein OmpA-like peptidoglycan-associated protein
MKTLKTHQLFGAAGLFVASALGSAVAQSSNPPANNPQNSTTQATQPSSNTMSPDNSASYATGKPLDTTQKEGFWGHMNPLARKKWVHRQIDPIKDRTNELDQLQAKNASDIKDVDARATAGINQAMSAAQTADAHAEDAASKATQANSVAVAADSRATALHGTVSNLDQYQTVSSIALPFYKGRTTLTTRQKANLDEVAASLANEKGYIVEVEGYSRNGVASSQTMADAVVRYLVTAHQVPVYRIYRTGLGNAKQEAANDDKLVTNGVRVTVLHNSLATMSTTTGNANVPANPASKTSDSLSN